MILVLADLWLPFPGGAERLIFNLARDLMHRGEDVQVVTDYAAGKQFDGPPLRRESIGVYEDRERGLQQLLDLVDEYQPDVILTHTFFASQFGADLIARTRRPVVQILCNGERVKGVAFAVYISQWVWDTFGGKAADIIITPPVFDDVVADRHGDAIGFIKPIAHKGIELLYEIAEAMPEREFLVLRGEWYTLEDIRERPNVRFMQPVDDMRDFYAEVGLVLMPSRSEDAGTVAQEATANGLPCISSAVGGLNETNGGGLRIPVEAGAETWAAAIRFLDAPANRSAIVGSQQAHLAGTGQEGRLDEFAARMRALHR